MDNRLVAFERLLNIMDDLREKCPWDRKQTMETLRPLTIEETYELADAILDNNLEEVKKELGDLLLHMVFYAKIGSEKGAFDIADVLNGICEKLIHRHPHIYGDIQAETAEQVKQNWESIKLKEGKKSVLEGVPKSLPAVVKASRVQEKVAGVGFDWENKNQVWDKVQEELLELQEEVAAGNKDKIEAEFGDVMFALINYARFIGVEAENALARTNSKFISRFQFMEEAIQKEGKKMQEMKLAELDVYWDKSKEVFK
ncbi:MAG TPA: nucleoside triphosphate pyrophosphohydrolase [Bacteroidia bacterium]